jgi:hypothetical protein
MFMFLGKAICTLLSAASAVEETERQQRIAARNAAKVLDIFIPPSEQFLRIKAYPKIWGNGNLAPLRLDFGICS